MTEQDWLTSEDPAAMLETLRNTDSACKRHGARPGYVVRVNGQDYHYPGLSDRKLRLFACSCHRVAATSPGKRALRAIEAAESYADGGPFPLPRFGMTVEAPVAFEAAQTFAFNTGPRREFAASRAALLRDVFGNPFRPVALTDLKPGDGLPADRGVWPLPAPAWLTPTVQAIARRCYDERDFTGLPVLADALEETGCQEEAILQHLRGFERCWECAATRGEGGLVIHCGPCRNTGWRPLRGEHVRGCWVLDLLLGKE